ncbi:unnamed protein product [Ceutorhynchus assimilis]|uniref:Spaetzle domain-containing protein n=1 Tax=Ceutorhynchus assimilis TaxID=467358 RepID=A0A9N9QJ41_9CUCU|nr:unnamed protein product [Ceutorhynchus assimilis]
MIRCFILLLYACTIFGIGYDAGGSDRATCGRPYRAGRRYQPPCDLNRYGYCSQAGQLYPWRAVRRFVKDNQGLMKRMYGDQRHGHVLKSELEDPEEFDEEDDGNNNWKPTQVRFARYQHQNDDIDNELDDFDDIDDEGPRYFRGSLTNDDVLNTKFVISEQEAAIAIKLAELKASAHFRRPASHRSQYTTQKYHSTPTTTTTTEKSKTTTETNEINNEEAATQKSTTKAATEASSLEMTEEAAVIAVSTTTTEDTSTTETTTTTDRTTEWLSKKITTTTPIITTDNSTDDSVKLNSEDMDQTVESSENSEVYSEQLKQLENTPAMLFQDMDSNNGNKKKEPINFNKMKGVNACPVKEEVVAPFWANNTRGEVLALLNMYPFEQYVHWEKCTFENRQMYCREGCRCEQQYRLHRLLAYDPNNECRGIFSDWFRFPSCCVCKCYDIPPEFRVTSRSPRFEKSNLGEEEEYNNSS